MCSRCAFPGGRRRARPGAARGDDTVCGCAARTACSSSCSDGCCTSSGTRARRASASAPRSRHGPRGRDRRPAAVGEDDALQCADPRGASVHDAKEHVGMAQIADDRLDAVAARTARRRSRPPPSASRTCPERRDTARQPAPRGRAPVRRRRLLAGADPAPTSSSSSWSCWWRIVTRGGRLERVRRRRSPAIRGCGRRRRRSRRCSPTSTLAARSRDYTGELPRSSSR